MGSFSRRDNKHPAGRGRSSSSCEPAHCPQHRALAPSPQRSGHKRLRLRVAAVPALAAYVTRESLSPEWKCRQTGPQCPSPGGFELPKSLPLTKLSVLRPQHSSALGAAPSADGLWHPPRGALAPVAGLPGAQKAHAVLPSQQLSLLQLISF